MWTLEIKDVPQYGGPPVPMKLAIVSFERETLPAVQVEDLNTGKTVEVRGKEPPITFRVRSAEHEKGLLSSWMRRAQEYSAVDYKRTGVARIASSAYEVHGLWPYNSYPSGGSFLLIADRMIEISGGAALIARERERQVSAEGWTTQHDDRHTNAELVRAAQAYIEPTRVAEVWPWEESWWKPSTDPIRNLVKAGALIAAEIDRLQRKAGSP